MTVASQAQAFANWQDSATCVLPVMLGLTAIAHFPAKAILLVVSAMVGPVNLTDVLELLGAAGILLAKFRAVWGTCSIAFLIGGFVANMSPPFKGIVLRGEWATPLC